MGRKGYLVTRAKIYNEESNQRLSGFCILEINGWPIRGFSFYNNIFQLQEIVPNDFRKEGLE